MTYHNDQADKLNFDIRHIDVIEIERQARLLRTRVVADAMRTGWAKLRARLRRAPEGQTA